MTFRRLGLALAFAGLIPTTAVIAGSPGIAYSAKLHGPADFKWPYDGTRDSVFANLKRLLGAEKNPFGPVADADAPEGVLPEGSEFLADYLPHVIGIPGPEVLLPDSLHLYSGAEPHNATRKAAVITHGRGGQIVAIAVLTVVSVPRQSGHNTYGPNTNEMTILVPRNGVASPALQSYFTGWARNEINDSNELLRGSTLSKGVDELTVETRLVGVDKP